MVATKGETNADVDDLVAGEHARFGGLADAALLSQVAGYGTGFILIFVVTMVLYTYLPNRRVKPTFGIPGAILVTVAVVVLPALSVAVTVKLKPVPAVASAGATTTSLTAWPALTSMVPLVPVSELVASEAVIVWLPEVAKVALKVPTPLDRVELTGRLTVAPGSLVVKLTVPVGVPPNWGETVAVSTDDERFP